jgi:hypothetical protein
MTPAYDCIKPASQRSRCPRGRDISAFERIGQPVRPVYLSAAATWEGGSQNPLGRFQFAAPAKENPRRSRGKMASIFLVAVQGGGGGKATCCTHYALERHMVPPSSKYF